MELSPLCPGGAATGDTKQRLKDAMKRDALQEASEVLEAPDLTSEEIKDLLELVCTEGSNDVHQAHLAEILLTRTPEAADPNTKFSARVRCPVHLAAERGRCELLRKLLRYGARPSELTGNGETALHSAVRGVKRGLCTENAAVECARLLVEHKVDVDLRDDMGGWTAIHFAAKSGLWSIVTFLLSQSAHIDITKGEATARDLINQTRPDLIVNYPIQQEPPPDFKTHLFSLLEERNETEFILSIDNNSSVNVNATNGKHTLLQRAVAQTLLLATKKLLERGVDVNAHGMDVPPVLLAVNSGHVEILSLLLEHKHTDFSVLTEYHKSTILHRVVLSPHPTATRCLELILHYATDKKKLGRRAVDINAQDFRKYTALHYAAKCNNLDHIKLLLDKNANIFIYNDRKTPAFFDINPKYISDYLDRRISMEGENITDNKYALVFDYNFLVAPRVVAPVEENGEVSTKDAAYVSVPTEPEDPSGEIHEMEPLMLLASSPNHRSLLTHPVFRSFLHLKWLRVYWLFYANFLTYLLFTVSLSLHIYSLVSTESAGTNSTAELKGEVEEVPKNLEDKERGMFWGPTLVFLIWLIFREVSQMLMTFTQYVWHLENWLEVVLIGLTGTLLLAPLDSNMVDMLSACAVLLAYTELVMLLGRHPSLATYITMFFRVSCSFFYFLLWYSLLVVSFGFSFYIIFRHCKDDCEDNFFTQLSTSLFKTVIMLTGEFDAGDLHFGSVSVISHIIFLLFLFFIAIVLLNLLNGLAVSDTQAIRDEAQVVCCVAQVKLFDKIENTWFGSKNGICGSRKSGRGRNWIASTILLLSGRLPEKKIRVFLNEDNRVEPDVKNACQRGLAGLATSGTCCLRKTCVRKSCRWCLVFNTIVSDARAVAAQQNQESETQQLIRRIESLETNILAILRALNVDQQVRL